MLATADIATSGDGSEQTAIDPSALGIIIIALADASRSTIVG
jgi:hypothetical protein